MRGLDTIKFKSCVITVLLVFGLQADATTPELQKAMRAATFEVVMKKPEKDPLSYEKPLPLELLPYMERTDQYRSIGTAFSLGHNTYVTAGHVLNAGINSQFGPPALRNADGKVFAIDQIIKYSVHEDFAVFTVTGDPAPQGLAVNRSPQINDSVFAVGNALGDGVVIRDGLYTSDTPEEQDGRWKWIRFSAPASPGNSGGPLIDTSGAVIGIVIGKSPNENLNYSLPISRVLDAPNNKAMFDTRYLQSLPYLHGTMTHSLKAEFALPKNWEAFASAYMQLSDRDTKQARDELLAKYSSTFFPVGADEVLYDDDHKYNPQLIMQQADELWESDSARFENKDLPVDGFIRVGTVNNVFLFRLHRPDDAADAAFYRDSKAFMDMALKGMDIKRHVGTDAVRVTSLGTALRENKITDKYGRVWQQRLWALPYLDAYVVAMMLPTPDGYVGVLEYTPSAMINPVLASSNKVAELIDISYWGTVEQWQSFLKQRELVPQSLAKLQLDIRDSTSLHLSSSRVVLDIPSKLLKTSNKSPLSIDMNYGQDAGQTNWNINSISVYADMQRRAYIALTRHPKPVATMKRSYQDDWGNLSNRRSPYDARPSRETTDTWAATTVIPVNSTVAGKLSDSLMYSVKVGVENYLPSDEMTERLKLARDAIQIVEKGSGVTSNATLSTQSNSAALAEMKDVVDRIVMGLPEIARSELLKADDKNRDMRDRSMSDDIREYLITSDDLKNVNAAGDAFKKAYQTSNLEEAQAQRDALQALNDTIRNRFVLISAYWSSVRSLNREHQMWRHALENDHLPADTPHDKQVNDSEMQLLVVLTRDGPANDTWKPKFSDHLSALINDRNRLARRIAADALRASGQPPSPAALQRDSTHSNAANVITTTSERPPGNLTTAAKLRHPIPNLDDYYPSACKRNGEEGLVMLSVKLDANGNPMSALVIASSGSDALDNAALAFYKNLKFDPALRGDKPVDTTVTLPINFRLMN